MTEYTLIRSKRKTLALFIRDGKVEARAPLRLPRRDIDDFVRAKEKWILNRLANSREQAARREAFTLRYGGMALFRGVEYPIAARAGSRAGFDGEGFYMPPDLPPERIKAACVQIYRALAKPCLTARALDYAKLMGVMPSAVRVSGAKTRWGSCSAGKTLNFSWRLVMAGDDVIDYVVVHELAHLKEMNHSPRFWAVVEGVLPDFRERKAALIALQRRLAGEDWE